MKRSKHAIKRGQQRGIPPIIADIILLCGQARKKPGGAEEYSIPNGKRGTIISELKRVQQLVEKTRNKAVLVDSAEEKTIITIYHNDRK